MKELIIICGLFILIFINLFLSCGIIDLEDKVKEQIFIGKEQEELLKEIKDSIEIQSCVYSERKEDA